MKRRIIAGIIVLVVLWIAAVPIAYDLDALLSQRYDYVWNPIWAFLLVLRNDKALKMLLLLLGVMTLAVIACLTAGSNVTVRTGMQQITPDISIPKADGQGQFGTARFLSKKKYEKTFTAYKLPKDGLYQNLIEEGERNGKKYDK